MRIKTIKYPAFSDFDFIRLYCAMSIKFRLSPVVIHHEIEKKLSRFYVLPEFRELFQGLCLKKDYSNPENNYVDLNVAFQTANLYGLLIQIHDTGEIRSIIAIDENESQKIILDTDVEMVNSMNNLFNEMIDYDKENSESHIGIYAKNN